MKTRMIMAGAVAAALTAPLAAPMPAQAQPLVLGDGWEYIEWSNPDYPDLYGGPIFDAFSGDETFTFTLTSNAVLNITDAFYNLPMFDLTVNGVDFGPTSTPNQDYAYIDGYAPGGLDAAFADVHFSHGSYGLAAGDYTVTGYAFNSYYGYGVGGIELAVPEPATWAMMLIGFGAIGSLARRRTGRSAPG